MNSQDALLILPARNEEKNIKALLPRLPKAIDALFIDDASSDSTVRILQHNNCMFLHNPYQIGVSQCILKGVQYAVENSYKKVICMDTDLQHDPFTLPRFLEALCDSEFVYANRFSSAHCIPTSKVASNCFASKLVKQFLGYVIPDVSCGFRAFIIDSFSHYFNDLDLNSYEIIYDMLFHALTYKLKASIISIPSIYYPSTLWCTRKSEISALLNAINRYANSNRIASIINMVNKKNSFMVTVDSTDFYLHYLSSIDSFFIQADTNEVLEYYDRF